MSNVGLEHGFASILGYIVMRHRKVPEKGVISVINSLIFLNFVLPLLQFPLNLSDSPQKLGVTQASRCQD